MDNVRNLNSLQQQVQNLIQQTQAQNQQYGQPQFQQPTMPVNPIPATQIVPPIQSRQVQYVDGLQGAKVYQDGMPSNSSEVIMDKNENIFYYVSKDANGFPSRSIPIGHFTLEEAQTDEPTFLTRKDFDDFKEEMKQLLMSQQKPTTTTTQKVTTTAKKA